MKHHPSGLGKSHRQILDQMKWWGDGTIPEVARALDLSVETVRSHMRSLRGEGLVARAGRRRSGPGRPEDIYRLTESAASLFPDRHAEILQEFVGFLEKEGDPELIHRFFHRRIELRREEAFQRLTGLQGIQRLQEVAEILSEEGFMADVETDGKGPPSLRLHHCPMRDLIDVTRAPCRAELQLVRELLGQDLTRIAYIPSGDVACSYTPSDHEGRSPWRLSSNRGTSGEKSSGNNETSSSNKRNDE